MKRIAGALILSWAAAAFAQPGSAVDRGKLEPLHDAGKAFREALADPNATFGKVADLRQKLEHEVARYEGREATPSEKRIVELYGAAARGYEGARTRFASEKSRDHFLADVRQIESELSEADNLYQGGAPTVPVITPPASAPPPPVSPPPATFRKTPPPERTVPAAPPEPAPRAYPPSSAPPMPPAHSPEPPTHAEPPTAPPPTRTTSTAPSTPAPSTSPAPAPAPETATPAAPAPPPVVPPPPPSPAAPPAAITVPPPPAIPPPARPVPVDAPAETPPPTSAPPVTVVSPPATPPAAPPATAPENTAPVPRSEPSAPPPPPEAPASGSAPMRHGPPIVARGLVETTPGGVRKAANKVRVESNSGAVVDRCSLLGEVATGDVKDGVYEIAGHNFLYENAMELARLKTVEAGGDTLFVREKTKRRVTGDAYRCGSSR